MPRLPLIALAKLTMGALTGALGLAAICIALGALS
jgi:hypothetical protein